MAKPVEWTFRARKKCIYIYFMLISLQFDDSSYKCERKKMYGTQQTATKIENVIMSMNVSVNMYVYMLVYMFVCVCVWHLCFTWSAVQSFGFIPFRSVAKHNFFLHHLFDCVTTGPNSTVYKFGLIFRKAN